MAVKIGVGGTPISKIYIVQDPLLLVEIGEKRIDSVPFSFSCVLWR